MMLRGCLENMYNPKKEYSEYKHNISSHTTGLTVPVCLNNHSFWVPHAQILISLTFYNRVARTNALMKYPINKMCSLFNDI